MKSLKEYLVPTVTLFIICLVAAALLGITNDVTSPIISDLAAENEINLFLSVFYSVAGVAFDSFFELFDTFRRIVKVGNRIMQTFARQIDKLLLKFTECTGDTECLFGRFKNVVRTGAFDKNVCAPAVAVIIKNIRQIILSTQETDSSFLSFVMGFAYFG